MNAYLDRFNESLNDYLADGYEIKSAIIYRADKPYLILTLEGEDERKIKFAQNPEQLVKVIRNKFPHLSIEGRTRIRHK